MRLWETKCHVGDGVVWLQLEDAAPAGWFLVVSMTSMTPSRDAMNYYFSLVFKVEEHIHVAQRIKHQPFDHFAEVWIILASLQSGFREITFYLKGVLFSESISSSGGWRCPALSHFGVREYHICFYIINYYVIGLFPFHSIAARLMWCISD